MFPDPMPEMRVLIVHLIVFGPIGRISERSGQRESLAGVLGSGPQTFLDGLRLVAGQRSYLYSGWSTGAVQHFLSVFFRGLGCLRSSKHADEFLSAFVAGHRLHIGQRPAIHDGLGDNEVLVSSCRDLG